MKNVERIIRLFSVYFSKQPAYLILFVTSRCNARCKMCFNWQNNNRASKEQELSLSEIISISEHFKNIMQFTISGGEPFLRDDISEIVNSFYKNSRARMITIPTNGSFPEKIATATVRILENCPSCLLNVGLSIDGIGEKHDQIRQLPGCFDLAVETYHRLNRLRKKYNNFYLKMTTVLSKYNKDEIEHLFDYADKHFDIDEHELLLARGNTRDPSATNLSARDYKDAIRIVNKYAAKNCKTRNIQFSRLLCSLYKQMQTVTYQTISQNKMIYPCLAGKRLVEIYDDGAVVPCEILKTINKNIPATMGNLRDFHYDIQRVLRSKEAIEIIDYIEKTECRCSFECAVLTNIVFNPFAYPALLKKFFA
jgi:MoaA/NifB/PqqE/SkfB family radical SAM enzyme